VSQIKDFFIGYEDAEKGIEHSDDKGRYYTEGYGQYISEQETKTGQREKEDANR
jgi:hypothetical protein